MEKVESLIAALAHKASPVKLLPQPSYWIVRLLLVLVVYAVATQYLLGVRADIAVQLQRPFFLSEIALLFLLTATSAMAAIYALYPDNYQRNIGVRLPFALLGMFTILLAVQAFLPYDPRMVIPLAEKVHGMDCTLCIASAAILPSAAMFIVLLKGAGVRPMAAGAIAVLTASGIGCLTLRLAEANDSLSHLVTWHYLPTVLFSCLGAWIGKNLLKW